MKIFKHNLFLVVFFLLFSSFLFLSFCSMGQTSSAVLVRLDETTSADRQTLLQKEMALLERTLDDSYFQTTSEGKLYFRFLEKYVDAQLSVSVYDWRRNSLLSTSVTVSKAYGENWYVLDGQALGLVLNQYYFVEVLDENKQKTVLRFKYLLAFTPLALSCQGSDPVCDQTIVIADPIGEVPLSASIEEGTGPFRVRWILVKENGDGTFTEVVLKEETTNEMNHSYVVRGWQSPYTIYFKVEDACRNEKRCSFCVSSPNDERVSLGKSSKFFFFFNLKGNKKDKEKITPTSTKEKDTTN